MLKMKSINFTLLMMVLVMTLAGCKSNSEIVCEKPIVINQPNLSQLAKQKTVTENCKPTCSENLATELRNMRESLTKTE